jgi:hypothetical protein
MDYDVSKGGIKILIHYSDMSHMTLEDVMPQAMGQRVYRFFVFIG